MSNAATKIETPEPPITTESVLAEMLKENTGRSMLDSGDHYGRNYESNQGVDFESQPATSIDKYGLFPTLNVYHWLKERLAFDPEMDARLQAFVETPEMERECGLACMEAFVEEHLPEATGLYGDGQPFTVNTYNGECSLSQTLQFHYFEMGDQPYLALQIHGGCDVRGGYTMPKIFKVTDDGGAVFDYTTVSVYCDNAECEAYWDSEDGGYNFVAVEWDTDFQGGDLKANEDGNYVCPDCGKGHLKP